MAWIIVYDNHGHETGRWHHSELEKEFLPAPVLDAVQSARQTDIATGPCDPELQQSVVSQ